MLPENIKNNTKHLIISTGNVLSVNKKAGQKATEELIDCLNLTLNEHSFNKNTGQIDRLSDDLLDKITEHERNNIKIGAKVFLNENSIEYLNEAVNSLLRILNVNCLDNLILAYHPSDSIVDDKLNPSTEIKEGVLEWGGKNARAIEDLKKLWLILENFSKNKKICNLGISDLDTDSLSNLYKNCEVRPTIAQINLSACCVVPPSLQEFCNSQDIQLLTHSDPEGNDSLAQWDLGDFQPTWVIRYQVHVKCRGLLTAKGYIVGAKKL